MFIVQPVPSFTIVEEATQLTHINIYLANMLVLKVSAHGGCHHKGIVTLMVVTELPSGRRVFEEYDCLPVTVNRSPRGVFIFKMIISKTNPMFTFSLLFAYLGFAVVF